MDTKAYERIFSPKSVAVVGASATASRFGGRILHRLDVNGYSGSIYPVNPKYEEIGGRRCYPTVADVDGEVDAAILTVSNEYVLPTLEDCVKKNVGLAVLFGAGYAETGPEGELAQEELKAVTERSSLRILGPNCLGFLNVWDRVPATAAGVVDPPKVRQGGISIVAQSGFVGMETIFGRGYDAAHGFRYVITTGNEADLEASELLCWLAQDEKTTVIVAYLEGIRNPAKFREAAALAREAGKPIVMLKAGRSPEGERAARSHTAALAMSDSVLDAVCEADGIVRVTDLDDLWELAGVLADGVRINGPRVAIIGTSGGINTIVSDDLRDAGLELPSLNPSSTVAKLAEILPWYASTANPVDLTGYFGGAGRQDVFPQLARLVASDPGIDVVIFAVQVDRPVPWDDVIPGLVDELRGAEKPIVVLSGGASAAKHALDVLKETGIPVFWSPARCARTIGLIAGYCARVASLAGKAPRPAGANGKGSRTLNFAAFNGSRARWEAERELLTAYQIPTVATEVVSSEDEAREAAGRLGYPVVAKGFTTGIKHKSDLGLVKVGIRDDQQLDEVFRTLSKQLDGDAVVVIQPMIQGGIELIAGIQNDPTFGPVIVVGVGGVLVELLGERRLAMPPVDRSTARAMLESLRAAPLFGGFRGGDRYDIEAVAEILAHLSQLATDLGDGISGLDLNPVIMLQEGHGAVAVDWVIETKVIKSLPTA